MRADVPILITALLAIPTLASKLRTGDSYNATSLFADVLSGPCRYIDFCQSTTSVEFNGKPYTMSCCFPYSCTDDCWERGDCCPDKTTADDTTTRTRRNETCIWNVVNQAENMMYNKPTGLGLYRLYYIVNTCPPNTEDTELVNKCEETPSKNQTSINDLVFVSSRDDSFIYKNRYCAACYDVTDFVQWVLIYTCKSHSYMPILESEWISESTLEACTVDVVPPTNQERLGESARCYLPTITSCNMTGDWGVYDSMIADACVTHDFMYAYEVVPGISRPVAYANVFCYMCNNAEHNNIPHTCNDHRDAVKRTLVLPFTYVLNMDLLDKIATTQKLVNDKAERCDHDLVLDRLTDSCRQLVCPINSYALLGRCERKVTTISGLPVAMKMRVTCQEIGPSLQQMWFDDHSDFVNLVIGLIIRHVGFDSMACERCTKKYSIISTENQTGAMPDAMYILVGITTTPTCQDPYILSTLQHMQHQDLDILYDGIPGELSNLTARLDIHIPDQIFANVFSFGKVCSIENPVDLSEKFYCPSIRLSTHDYQLFVNKSKKSKNINPSIFTKIVTNEVTEYAVCYEEYIAAVHKIFNNVAVMGNSKMVWCMLLVCIVGLMALL